MNALLAVLLLCSAAPALAQSYGAAPSPQTETGPQNQPPVQNAVGSQQPVTNQTGISNFMPMHAPALEAPAAASAPTPAVSSKKTTVGQCASGGERVNGVCRAKCASGETRNAKGTCTKSDSQQPSMPAGGAGGDDKKADDKNGPPEKPGADGKPNAAGMQNSGGTASCSGSGGLCGDSSRGEKTAKKLSTPFKTGLQPGSSSMPPEARENPSGYSGELGKVGSYDFSSPRQRAESASGEAQKAGREFSSLQSNVQSERAAFVQAYGGIKVGVSVESGMQDVLTKVAALEGALTALKASGSRTAESVRTCAQKTSAASEAGGRALSAVQESFQTTGRSVQSADQTYGTFQTLRGQYDACVDPYTQQACRSAVAAQASSAKASYLPDSAVRSAESARNSTKEARQSLAAAQTAQTQAESALSSLAQEGQSARSQLNALKQDFVARFKPSSDPNQIARTRAFGAIVEKLGAFLTGAESIRTGTLVPASGSLQEAQKSLRSSLDGA
ncbi:MAG: hypothetical protein WC969_10225 [Elusimicrobiota bacterium]|jgi:hypothetical protein